MKKNRVGRLDGKIALITGAADGIGRAAAILFAQEGAKLIITDVNEMGLDETIELVKKEGGVVAGRKADVSCENDVEDLINLTVETYGMIDIVCNNAGITGQFLGLDQEDGTDWLKVYAVNVLGAVYAVKHAAKYMREQKSGAIVNTASVAGIRAGAGLNAYSASKAALINCTKTAACDLGAFNIRVNAVCPGLIETGMTRPIFDLAREKGKEEKLGSRCELRRYGRPEEVARAICFLASDDASFITGQALPVDGGNTASLNMPGMKI
ncbi:MAG TPA: SDR family NAD(P)-dependent oxidoreductase [Smithella sp.]|nr:SDR family NAD(P)-dependent oxidoreductase [Smithella sp.]